MGGVASAGGTEPGAEMWHRLRRATRARIGLGRAGDALPTEAVLDLAAAHAEARDAVHEPLDIEALTAQLRAAGFDPPLVLRSRAASRSEYLRRPDLGREPGAPIAGSAPQLTVVLADGLSARAVAAHGVGVLSALREVGVVPDIVVIAVEARVALGDHVGAALGSQAVVVLIGERPGLSTADSLGAYLTWEPRPGRADAQRNCVSNIHPPDGLDHASAARSIAGLLRAAAELGESGVRLKDRSRTSLDEQVTRAAIEG